MTFGFEFWFTLAIGALIVALLAVAVIIAVWYETRRVVRGIRAGTPVGPITEARRTLSRAADLRFPSHRKEQP